MTGSRLVPDSIPEDMSLLVNTDNGFVVVAGCGHAGTVNTVEYARRILGTEPAYAMIGGLHLVAAVGASFDASKGIDPLSLAQ